MNRSHWASHLKDRACPPPSLPPSHWLEYGHGGAPFWTMLNILATAEWQEGRSLGPHQLLRHRHLEVSVTHIQTLILTYIAGAGWGSGDCESFQRDSTIGVGFLLSSNLPALRGSCLKHCLSSCYPRRQRAQLEKPDQRWTWAHRGGRRWMGTEGA